MREGRGAAKRLGAGAAKNSRRKSRRRRSEGGAGKQAKAPGVPRAQTHAAAGDWEGDCVVRKKGRLTGRGCVANSTGVMASMQLNLRISPVMHDVLTHNARFHGMKTTDYVRQILSREEKEEITGKEWDRYLTWLMRRKKKGAKK